jgi:hypothetical protein
MSRRDDSNDPVARAGGAPAPAPATSSSSSLERVVALALAAMALVLGLVVKERLVTPARVEEEPFDFVNPMLSAQPGQCVEISTDGTPYSAALLYVRPQGVVLRPHSAPPIDDWINPRWPDPRVFPPYVLAEQRAAPGAPPVAGAPPNKPEVLVYPLDSFGFTLEQTVVLRGIQKAKVQWNSQTRDAYVASFMGYVDSEGPWIVSLSKDAPVLGVMRRQFISGGSHAMQHSFRVPETCR